MDQKHWDKAIRTANDNAVRTGVRQRIQVEKTDSGAVHTFITATGKRGGKS